MTNGQQFELFDSELQAGFEKFDRENPSVWDAFVRFAVENEEAVTARRAAGENIPWRGSADMVMHRVRWESQVVVRRQGKWKVNNNHVAYYSRKFMWAHPKYDGFFEIRKVRGMKREKKRARPKIRSTREKR